MRLLKKQKESVSTKRFVHIHMTNVVTGEIILDVTDAELTELDEDRWYHRYGPIAGARIKIVATVGQRV